MTAWWNYDSSSSIDDFAWIYYDDYLNCNTEDHSLESCGGERGVMVTLTTGDGQVQPTTNNPFFGMSTKSAYLINFKCLYYDGNGSDVSIQLLGSNTMTGGSGTVIGTSNIVPMDGECHDLSIAVIELSAIQDLVIFPYIYFRVKTGSLPVATLTVFTVIDEVSACTLFSYELNTDKCDQLCVEFKKGCEFECSNEIPNNEEEDNCYMEVYWWDESGTTDYEYCHFSSISDEYCCFTPPSNDTYAVTIYVKITINGKVQFYNDFFQVDFAPCSTATITTTTTWDANDIDALTRFDLITVQSGVTLNIEDDLTLKFCEDGRLVINPGGKVVLDGVLTSDCSTGWLGVEVQGNGTSNQYPSSGLYPQGQIYCNAGSIIENAETAVKLYGPDFDDARGMIYAEGANFINNSRGLDFAPFSNYFPTTATQKFYQSKIRDCTFNITDTYAIPWTFIEHIRLNGVFGIGVYGTFFGHERSIPSASSPMEFGTGIKAINSNFFVGASTHGSETFESRFERLGIGVSVGKFLENRPFQIYNCEFEKCFFGISNENVSGGNILFNDFNFGTVPEIDGDEDQIGISMSGYQMFTAIQENTFTKTEGNADFTIGIVSNHLGEMNNAIRRNTFSGLAIGNQAFNRNAQEDKITQNTGLHYLCNTNSNVKGFDFWIPVELEDQRHFIRHEQGVLGLSVPGSSGNTFSRTGDINYGDFANRGGREISYWQNQFDSDEILEDFTTATIDDVDLGSSECDPEFCLHPCLVPEDFEDEVSDYYENLENYEDAISEEEFETAAFHLGAVHVNLNNIARFIELDTTSFNRDTMRKWYRRHHGVTGELLLAGDYQDAGLVTIAGTTIDSIPVRYMLGDDQELDMARVGRIYDILSSRSIYSLTSTDVDSLNVFAEAYGASYSIARSILMLLDTVYTPRYYVPGEVDPRSEYKTVEEQIVTPIGIYPNPISFGFYITMTDGYDSNFNLEIIGVDGSEIFQARLEGGVNYIDISSHHRLVSGVYIFHITRVDGMVMTGRLLIL